MGAAAKNPRRLRLPDGSRSVQSVWVWRGFLFMSLIALGLAIGLYSAHNNSFGVLWTVIALGWFGISMYLWRQHVQWDSEEYARSQGRGAKSPAKPSASSKRGPGRK